MCMMHSHVYVSGTEKVEIAVNKFKKYALPGIGVIPLEVVYSGWKAVTRTHMLVHTCAHMPTQNELPIQDS